MTSEWRIERLTKQHDRKGFDCGQPALNDFLKRFARQNDQLDMGLTYVAVEPGSTTILGFYTLSSGHVPFDALPLSESKGLPRHPIPVVLLARLAVDRRHQKQGIGESLLVDALRRAAQASETVGVRAIAVDAKNESARAFYQHFGFLAFADDPLHLFLPMETVRKACENR